MTEPAWSAESARQLLRTRLSSVGAVVDGFHDGAVLSAVSEGSDATLTVTFRWFRDPAVYAVSFPVPATPVTDEGFWSSFPVAGAEGWISEVTGWLEEELDTGFVHRADRVLRDGLVFLSGADNDDIGPPDHWTSVVPTGEGASVPPGRHLRSVGLDTEPGVDAERSGRLLVWFQAYWNRGEDIRFVGHAVVSRMPGMLSTLRLDLVEATSAAPIAVAHTLAFHALRAAVEDGSRQLVVGRCDPDVLAAIGFSDVREGGPLELARLARPR